jgi:nucleoside-diphosphate-sugar epimerase
MSGYLFLTGATGLLGRYLVRDLLERDQRLAILVRGSRHESAIQRIESILQYWENQSGQSLARPVVLEGDLREPAFGLSDRDQRWVSKHCSSIMHSAASLTFHEDSRGEPWLTNLGGTRHLLELCRACGLRQLHYVSTAYVCGLREGTILESELDCGQDFRNDYERSKLLAEKMVRDADCIDQLTVYRPAVIAGDSKTGYTNTYHGIYLYLRLMALLVPRQPKGPDGLRVTKLRMPMTGDERRNIIPIDWASQLLTRLYLNPEAHGHTFHLAPDQPLTPRAVSEAGYSYFNSTGVEFIGYEKIDPSSYNELEAQALPGLEMYNNYKSTDPTFDCSNVKRFAEDFPCPVIDEAMLHKYIQFGEEDKWGRRRSQSPKIEFAASDYFESLREADDDCFAACKSRLAIDLIGPGGGQWTLAMQSDGTLVQRPGLHEDSDSHVRFSATEFKQIISQPSDSTKLHAAEKLFPFTLGSRI